MINKHSTIGEFFEVARLRLYKLQKIEFVCRDHQEVNKSEELGWTYVLNDVIIFISDREIKNVLSQKR